MSRELNFFATVAGSQKLSDKPTNNCKQIGNAFVTHEHHCSFSYLATTGKMVIDGYCMESGWLWQGQGGCVRCWVFHCEWRWVHDKSFNVPGMIFLSDMKYPCDMLTLNYTLLDLRAQTLVFLHQKRCNLCSDGGGKNRVIPLWKTLCSEDDYEHMKWLLSPVYCNILIPTIYTYKYMYLHNIQDLYVSSQDSLLHRLHSWLLSTVVMFLIFSMPFSDFQSLNWGSLWKLRCTAGLVVLI